MLAFGVRGLNQRPILALRNLIFSSSKRVTLAAMCLAVRMLVEVKLHVLPRHEHHLRHLREAQGMGVLRWFSARVGKHMR